LPDLLPEGQRRHGDEALLGLERFFHTTDGLLNFAFDLIGLSGRLKLSVAGGLADGLEDFSFGDFRRPGDLIPVHFALSWALQGPVSFRLSTLRRSPGSVFEAEIGWNIVRPSPSLRPNLKRTGKGFG
jgi:hypothetical protein